MPFPKAGIPFSAPDAIPDSGLTRAAGKRVRVREAIPKGGAGTVLMDRRIWPAESLTGLPFKEDARVEVCFVRDGALVVKRVKPGA